MKLCKEQRSYAKLLLLESVAFTQQPGSDSAAPVRWHITAATASFAPVLSFRPALCSLSNKIVGYKVLLCRFRKNKNIIVINNLHFNQVSRQRFISHLCFGLFHKITFTMVSQKPPADRGHCVGVSSHACCFPFPGNCHDTATSTGVL